MRPQPVREQQQPRLQAAPPGLAGHAVATVVSVELGSPGAGQAVVSSNQTEPFPDLQRQGGAGFPCIPSSRSMALLNMHGDHLVTVPSDCMY